ncbi:hypothetical protein [Paracoccus jiaweipingae]|uniref:hypothetical protein n=1 Tax=unclassified Paracoccus (in: a-proteobacteria) TaxID=2688777 RepID=UPI0037AA913A
MAEIEIRTTGELIVNLEVVGRITWAKPLIESEIAGLYDDHGYGYDEWGDPFDCSPCDEKDDLLKDIEDAVGRVQRLLGDVSERLDGMGLSDGLTRQRVIEAQGVLKGLEFSV